MRLSEEALEEERETHAATKTELFQLSQEMVEQRDGFLREKTTLTAQLKVTLNSPSLSFSLLVSSVVSLSQDKETELESLRAKVSI